MNPLKLSFYRALILLTFSMFLLPLAGCDDSSSNPLDINIFSAGDDVTLGRQLDSSIKANPKEYPLLNNTAATAYVQGIVDEIIKSPSIKYNGTFSYKVTLINTTTINAFAAPGGYLYVYTGLLKFVDNEATLAAILAHEVAHAERRHATKRMTKQYGASLLLSLIIGKNPSQLEEIAANLLTGLGFLKNSRDDEYEADEYSFKYLQTSKWYPGASIYFFDKISKTRETEPTKLDELLSTHPLDADRIAAVKKLIKDAGIPDATEDNLFTSRYSQFKASLP